MFTIEDSGEIIRNYDLRPDVSQERMFGLSLSYDHLRGKASKHVFNCFL